MKRSIARMSLCLIAALALARCGQAPIATDPTPAPAWKEFTGGGASLWLPETYEALDLASGVDQQIARLSQFGGKYAQTAEMTRRSRRAFALWAFDTRSGYNTCAATVGVIRMRQVSPALSLDTIAGEVVRQLPDLAGGLAVQLMRQQTIALDDGAAVRMELSFPDACRKEVLYTIKRGDRFWMVVYAADAREFERRLPSFERSIATFTTAETLKG